jgi:hypothetical protein
MTEQPTAPRLADDLTKYLGGNTATQAASELRRLHDLAIEQQGKIYALEMARSMEQKTAKLKRDALLEALKKMLEVWEEDPAYGHASAEKARAAIKAVEGEKT